MKRLCWAALLCGLAASGCYHVTYVAPNVAPGPTHEETPSFFFWGLLGEARYDVRDFCPGEVARVQTGMSVVNGVLSVLTLGIYSPRTVSVTCAAGGIASAQRTRRQGDFALDGASEPMQVLEARGDDVRVRRAVPERPRRGRVTFDPEAIP